nr:putative reverse transcriptase, RNA-dependent DNA polymerase [Tanacetum cinerariifolium]
MEILRVDPLPTAEATYAMEHEDEVPRKYVLPPRSNRGVPPKRYSPEKTTRGAKYPMANIAEGNLSNNAKAFAVAHMNAALRIVMYLKGTAGHGVLFRSNGHLNIQMYTDADWAGDKGNRRSTSGYFSLVGGNLVTYRSKKQKVVSLSSAEAEFRGYGVNQKGYRCYSPKTHRLFTSMNCDFLKTQYYYSPQHSGQGEEQGDHRVTYQLPP